MKKAHDYKNDETFSCDNRLFKKEDGIIFILKLECIKESLVQRWHVMRSLAGVSHKTQMIVSTHFYNK